MASMIFYPGKAGAVLEEGHKLKKKAVLDNYEAMLPPYEIMSQ